MCTKVSLHHIDNRTSIILGAKLTLASGILGSIISGLLLPLPALMAASLSGNLIVSFFSPCGFWVSGCGTSIGTGATDANRLDLG